MNKIDTQSLTDCVNDNQSLCDNLNEMQPLSYSIDGTIPDYVVKNDIKIEENEVDKYSSISVRNGDKGQFSFLFHLFHFPLELLVTSVQVQMK